MGGVPLFAAAIDDWNEAMRKNGGKRVIPMFIAEDLWRRKIIVAPYVWRMNNVVTYFCL